MFRKQLSLYFSCDELPFLENHIKTDVCYELNMLISLFFLLKNIAIQNNIVLKFLRTCYTWLFKVHDTIFILFNM